MTAQTGEFQSARTLPGRELAARIRAGVAAEAAGLATAGRQPRLAVVVRSTSQAMPSLAAAFAIDRT